VRKRESPKAAEHRERIRLRHGIVLDYRIQGLDWFKIASLTKYTVEAARAAFKAETGVDPSDHRAEGRLLQRLRLERLTKITMREATQRSRQAALSAVPAALKVMERQAKLDGLDEPEKSELDLRGQVKFEDWLDEAHRRREERKKAKDG
jgi:hypothetical protein